MLLVYDVTDWPGKTKDQGQANNTSNFRKAPTYDGLLTVHAKKKLRIAIEILVAIALPKKAFNPTTNREFTFRINFITLTLPAQQGTRTDKEIKSKVLDPWIKKARRRFNLKNYVWRAERQKNGNIHFHITSDCYIPYDQLRDTWNDNLEALGFITEFEKKNGHRHPNSTDVHATRSIKNLAAYLVKYTCKGHDTPELYRAQPPWAKAERQLKARKNAKKFMRMLSLNEQRIDGKVWDCSTNLKGVKFPSEILDGEYHTCYKSAHSDPKCKIKNTDFAQIIFLTSQQFLQHIRGSPLELYNEWLKSIRN